MVQLLEELEMYAKEHRVPIMEPEGIAFLLETIKNYHCQTILELGTAIGYSAIRMCLVDPKITVVTVERDKEKYQLALENIQKAGLEGRITVIFGDALETKIDGMFDLLFIDAAKSQYIKFFERYLPNLKANGMVISDNLGFHGLVAHPEEIRSKNVRAMVRKLQTYRDYLKERTDFQTDFYEVGDGIAVSIRL